VRPVHLSKRTCVGARRAGIDISRPALTNLGTVPRSRRLERQRLPSQRFRSCGPLLRTAQAMRAATTGRGWMSPAGPYLPSPAPEWHGSNRGISCRTPASGQVFLLPPAFGESCRSGSQDYSYSSASHLAAISMRAFSLLLTRTPIKLGKLRFSGTQWRSDKPERSTRRPHW